MQLSTRRPLVLGMLLISALGLSASKSAFAETTAQPFSCGAGIQAMVVDVPTDRKFTVAKTGKAVEVISFGGDDSKAGMDVHNFPEPNKFFGLFVYVKESLGRTREQVNTRFCFSDKDGDFTITRELKDYQFEVAKDGWNLASVSAFELPVRAAQADLKRYTMILKSGKRPAVFKFGNVMVPQVDDVGQLLTDNAGCDGLRSCKNSDPDN